MQPARRRPLFTKSGTVAARVTPASISSIVAKIGKAAGVELSDSRVLAPHQLRHLWADAHYRAGTPEAVMRQLGGWQGSIPTTYGQDAAEERAIAIGLQSDRSVLGLIQERGRSR